MNTDYHEENKFWKRVSGYSFALGAGITSFAFPIYVKIYSGTIIEPTAMYVAFKNMETAETISSANGIVGNNTNSPVEQSVKNYIRLAEQEEFSSAYNDGIKSLDNFKVIRQQENYDEWFSCLASHIENDIGAQMTIAFSLAQLPFSQIEDFEINFIKKQIAKENNDIVYYALVAIENWDNDELNNYAKQQTYKNNYLQSIANNL